MGLRTLNSSTPISVTPQSEVAVSLIFVVAELLGRVVVNSVHVADKPKAGLSATDHVVPPSLEEYTFKTSVPEVFM